MGSGLAWGYASNALDQLLAQRKLEALQEADRQEKIRQFNVGTAERAREHDLNTEIHKNALAEQQRQHEFGRANMLYNETPRGTELTPETGRLYGQFGFPVEREQTLPSAQTAGGVPLVGAEGENGPGEPVATTVPSPAEATGRILATGGPKEYLATRAAEEHRRAGAEQFARQTQASKEAAAQREADREHFATLASGLKAAPQSHYTVQPEFDVKGQPTGRQFRVNNLTGELSYAQTPEEGARTKAPGNASLQTRLEAAQANLKTTHDVIRELQDPVFAAGFGPWIGRLGAAKNRWGSAPENYRKLMGDIESVALSSMAVHGMRSAEGAERIKAELAGINTPTALTAYLRGLTGFSRHLLEDNGRTVEPEPEPAAHTTTATRATRPRYDMNGQPLP